MNTEEAMQLMQKGFCAVCRQPISRHSRWKKKYCLTKCQDEFGVAKKETEIDGKTQQVRVFPKSLSDES